MLSVTAIWILPQLGTVSSGFGATSTRGLCNRPHGHCSVIEVVPELLNELNYQAAIEALQAIA